MKLPFNCIAIIVTYNPDLPLLDKLINRMSSQVKKIRLIDNHSASLKGDILRWNAQENIDSFQLSENKGLAVAYNQGIKFAKENNYTHVLLLDQDSLPEKDMVNSLYQAEQKLTKANKKVASVGPQFISTHDNHKTAFIVESKYSLGRSFCQLDELVKTPHLISSGSLIQLASLDKIGPMDEHLFIDYIDIEWCLRAGSFGYACYGVCDALMHHQLGEKSVMIKALNRRIIYHSSTRYYYQFRNAIYLYKLSYVPWKWIIYHFPRHILVKLVSILWVPCRIENYRNILLGFWHGISDKMGKLNNNPDK